MPILLVLNGPPAAGKSTVARRFVDDHRLALRIDVDELRDQLGRWTEVRADAGLRARALAAAMAADHLRAGHDVVIAQLYGHHEHLDALAQVAAEAGAAYAEVALMVDEATTIGRFTDRGGPRYEEATAEPDGMAAIAELHARVVALVAARPHAIVVESVPDDPEATYRAVVRAIADRDGDQRR